MPQLRLSQVVSDEKRRPEWAGFKEEWVERERGSIKKRCNSLCNTDGTEVMWIILYDIE